MGFLGSGGRGFPIPDQPQCKLQALVCISGFDPTLAPRFLTWLGVAACLGTTFAFGQTFCDATPVFGSCVSLAFCHVARSYEAPD
jgi:hypothetical protein